MEGQTSCPENVASLTMNVCIKFPSHMCIKRKCVSSRNQSHQGCSPCQCCKKKKEQAKPATCSLQVKRPLAPTNPALAKALDPSTRPSPPLCTVPAAARIPPSGPGGRDAPGAREATPCKEKPADDWQDATCYNRLLQTSRKLPQSADPVNGTKASKAVLGASMLVWGSVEDGCKWDLAQYQRS